MVQGHGDTRKIVDGMDVWTHGDPPRPFQVLGIIEDERPGDDPAGPVKARYKENTNPASKNARIDYHAGVLIASAAFNLGWTLENTSQSLSAVSIADTSSGERKSYWSGMCRQCTDLSVMRVIASCCSLSAQTISSAHWSS